MKRSTFQHPVAQKSKAEHDFARQPSPAVAIDAPANRVCGRDTVNASKKPVRPHFQGLTPEVAQSPSKKVMVQPKLMIGAPNDCYEQEADRIATQVVQRLNTPQLLEPEAMEEEPIVQRMPLVQRAGVMTGSVEALPEVTAGINAARGGGQSLDEQVQVPMEQAFGGVDFSGVRVHTDGRASRLNEVLGARAFTTGQDLFFQQGEYQPGNRVGKELIAHELTHVAQQRRSLYSKQLSILSSENVKIQRDLVGKAKKGKWKTTDNTSDLKILEDEKLGPVTPNPTLDGSSTIKLLSGRAHVYQMDAQNKLVKTSKVVPKRTVIQKLRQTALNDFSYCEWTEKAGEPLRSGYIKNKHINIKYQFRSDYDVEDGKQRAVIEPLLKSSEVLNVTHVRQGAVGSCQILASVGAFIHAGGDLSNLIEEHDDSTYTVTSFKSVTNDAGEVIGVEKQHTRLEKSFMHSASHGHPAVAALEKAFIAMQGKSWNDNPSFQILTDLLGVAEESIEFAPPAPPMILDLSVNPDDILAQQAEQQREKRDEIWEWLLETEQNKWPCVIQKPGHLVVFLKTHQNDFGRGILIWDQAEERTEFHLLNNLGKGGESRLNKATRGRGKLPVLDTEVEEKSEF